LLFLEAINATCQLSPQSEASYSSDFLVLPFFLKDSLRAVTDSQADTALVFSADEVIIPVLDHQLYISNPTHKTCLWSHSCISKPSWSAKRGEEELWKNLL